MWLRVPTKGFLAGDFIVSDNGDLLMSIAKKNGFDLPGYG